MQTDCDEDGIGDVCDNDTTDNDNDDVAEGLGCDNCPLIPNGSAIGSCVKTVSDVVLGTGVSCTNPLNDCNEGEMCDMLQEDFNDNGIGDACECYADCNCDTKIDLGDLVIMRGEFSRTDCEMSYCYADCNGDNKVDLSDLVIIKTQFLRTDCPACTDCLSYGADCTYDYECCDGCCCTKMLTGHCDNSYNCQGIGGGCRAY